MTAPKANSGRRVTHNRTKFDAAQPDWMSRAACKGTDETLWFPPPEKGKLADEAKDICACCPVVAECLQWAYDSDSWDGIFGGQTGTERRKAHRNALRRKQRGDAIA